MKKYSVIFLLCLCAFAGANETDPGNMFLGVGGMIPTSGSLRMADTVSVDSGAGFACLLGGEYFLWPFLAVGGRFDYDQVSLGEVWGGEPKTKIFKNFGMVHSFSLSAFIELSYPKHEMAMAVPYLQAGGGYTFNSLSTRENYFEDYYNVEHAPHAFAALGVRLFGSGDSGVFCFFEARYLYNASKWDRKTGIGELDADLSGVGFFIGFGA